MYWGLSDSWKSIGSVIGHQATFSLSKSCHLFYFLYTLSLCFPAFLHPPLDSSQMATTTAVEVQQRKAATITRTGKDADRRLDEHTKYEFGGPVVVGLMMAIFPQIMYYFWICLWFYDGQLVHPDGVSDVVPFLARMWGHVRNDAVPNTWATSFYLGLIGYQLLLAFIIPGYKQEGLPVPSLKYKTLIYNCNALGCWYTTLATSIFLHGTGVFRLTGIIDNFGPVMTVAILWGFGLSLATYVLSVLTGTAVRMSGNFLYDFWMGAPLNPRLGSVDLKMWQEIRIPWVLLFYISVAGACKQYEEYGYISPNMLLVVLGTGLYLNACAKGEECIPQTWDMFHEKDGFMLIFWNFAGVPFTYCYPVLYMARRHPDTYKFPLWANVLLFATLLTAHYAFDCAMGQKSHFKMEMQGIKHGRNGFPHFKGSHVKNPAYIQTAHGNRLLTGGLWAYARKINYTADYIQCFTWSLTTGVTSIIPYYFPVFFTVVLLHREGRDFERCAKKYGKDWEEYCRVVPYKFIPGVY